MCASRPGTGRRTSRSAIGCSSPTPTSGWHIYNGNAGVITGIDARSGQGDRQAGRGGGGAGSRGDVVGGGVSGVPARLCGDDLQGPRQDAGPYVSAAQPSLAVVSELCGADRASARARRCSLPPTRHATPVNWRGRWRGARCGPHRSLGPRPKSWPRGSGRQPRRRVKQPGISRSLIASQARAGQGRPPLGESQPVRRRQLVQPRVASTSGPAESAGSAQSEWLIPPRVTADGRDSLGRGLDRGSIAAAVAADPAVQREREARWHYLRGAYRDPHTARATLDEMVKRQGWTSAAARVAADPSQLGALRGKGWGSSPARTRGRSGKRRSAWPQRSGRAWSGSVRLRPVPSEPIGPGWRRSARADATGIPRLSAQAMAALGTIAAAPGRSCPWRGVAGRAGRRAGRRRIACLWRSGGAAIWEGWRSRDAARWRSGGCGYGHLPWRQPTSVRWIRWVG